MLRLPRRSVLKWICGLLTAGNAAIVSVPAFSYVAESLRRRGGAPAGLRRVARLDNLPPGRPVLVPIVGDRRDGWVAHSQELVGRVWLIRGETDSADPTKTSIRAHSAICPHLGCTIQLAADAKNYVCPCHHAAFELDGRRVPRTVSVRLSNAPRDLDELECRVVHDEATNQCWVEVKYEKFEQGLTTRTAIT